MTLVADNRATKFAFDPARKNSLKILLAAWAPFHAGAEVAAERLAIGLRDDGHNVTAVVGTLGESYERLRASGLEVRYLPLAFTDKFRWWRYQRVQRELRRLLLEVQPDVVHANDLPTSQMVGRAAGKMGIPRICHHRWIFGNTAVEWLNKFGAERHLFVSRALMDQLCGVSSRLLSSARAVVHDGLPLPALPNDHDRCIARRKLKLLRDTPIVLFAGQIIERKGVADLLHAWSTLKHRWRCQAELILVGDDLENNGRYRREMETLACRLQCGARFFGFQRNVPDWLTAADICVVPSHAEPLGNATLEAMAYGRPVIGAAVGGIPEMVVDNETGILVAQQNPEKLADAIHALLVDSELRARLGQAGRDRCEKKFSLRAHVDAVVDQYRQALSVQTASIA